MRFAPPAIALRPWRFNQWVEDFWMSSEKVYTPNSYKWIKKEYAETDIVGNIFKAISEHS